MYSMRTPNLSTLIKLFIKDSGSITNIGKTTHNMIVTMLNQIGGILIIIPQFVFLNKHAVIKTFISMTLH